MNSGPENFDDLVASARVIVGELLEEGIETFDAQETAAEPQTVSPRVADELDAQETPAAVAPTTIIFPDRSLCPTFPESTSDAEICSNVNAGP